MLVHISVEQAAVFQEDERPHSAEELVQLRVDIVHTAASQDRSEKPRHELGRSKSVGKQSTGALNALTIWSNEGRFQLGLIAEGPTRRVDMRSHYGNYEEEMYNKDEDGRADQSALDRGKDCTPSYTWYQSDLCAWTMTEEWHMQQRDVEAFTVSRCTISTAVVGMH